MKKLKVKWQVVVGFLMGIILSATTSYVVAETIVNSKDVYYEDNSSLAVNNVQDAIDGTCVKFSNELAKFLDKIYPVGSIYISTSLSTKEQVGSTIGGTWEAFGTGRTLLSSTGTSGQTGGSNTVSIGVANLPAHTHTISHTHTTPQTNTTTMSLTAQSAGGHTHGFPNDAMAFTMRKSGGYLAGHGMNLDSGYWVEYGKDMANMLTAGAHTHSVTGSVTVPAMTTSAASTSTSGSTGSGTAINVQNPYITVYMYKRIK